MKLSDLRPYQNKACAAVLEAWKQYDRVLVSMPTGSGKTCIGAQLVNMWPELAEGYDKPPRILWLAHREELIQPAAREIADTTGVEPGIEKAEQRALRDKPGCSVVVASIQTLMRPDRREVYDKAGFGLAVVDEGHHVVCKTWTEIINYFGSSKLIGLTATTDRTDEISLGQIFEHIAYHYDIESAIRDGWLAEIKQQYIEVEGLDFSKVRLNDKGDLSDADLDRVLHEEKTIHKIVAPMVKLIGDRPTMVFTPSVRCAEAVASVFPRYSNGGAYAASGKTDPEERRRIVEGYIRGDFQVLASCDLLREGFDAPRTAAIVMARPTKSRLVYAQAVGRGLRGGRLCPVPGKDDGCLIVDLVGASLKHKLVHAADLLGGRYDEVVVAEAKRRCEEKAEEDIPADVLAELDAANLMVEELRHAQRQKIIAEAKLRRKTIDPFTVFAVLDKTPERMPGWYDNPATEEQVKFLGEHGIKAEGALTFSEAKQLREEVVRRRRDGIASYKQARKLVAYGYSGSMKFEQARKVLNGIAKRGWKHTRSEAINRNRWKKKNGTISTTSRKTS